MAASLPLTSSERQPANPGMDRPVMAKATAGNPGLSAPKAWMLRLGAGLRRAIPKCQDEQGRPWTVERFSQEIGEDAREVGKWLTGERPVPVHRVLALRPIRRHFTREIVRAAGSVRIVETFEWTEDC